MYLDISWQGMPPSDESITVMWKKMVFSTLPTTLEEHALIKTLREVYSSPENVFFAQFKAADDPVFSWYASRNRLSEIGFLEKFLQSPAINRNASGALTYSSPIAPQFEFISGFCLDGFLATELFWGGCGRSFAGNASTAKKLGEGFCEALAGDRFEEITVYRSREAWSEWFQDYGADTTYVILDRRTGIFSLLLLTDSA